MSSNHQVHPWHGISAGKNSPSVVTAFIEVVPTDTVKYEIDKVSGYLQIDRPHKYSNAIPTLYGFIPQTYCSEKVAEYARFQSGKKIDKERGFNKFRKFGVGFLLHRSVNKIGA